MQTKHQNEKMAKHQATADVQNARLSNTHPQPSTPLVDHIVNDHVLHVCPAVNACDRKFIQVYACQKLLKKSFV